MPHKQIATPKDQITADRIRLAFKNDCLSRDQENGQGVDCFLVFCHRVDTSPRPPLPMRAKGNRDTEAAAKTETETERQWERQRPRQRQAHRQRNFMIRSTLNILRCATWQVTAVTACVNACACACALTPASHTNTARSVFHRLRVRPSHEHGTRITRACVCACVCVRARTCVRAWHLNYKSVCLCLCMYARKFMSACVRAREG